MRLFCLSLVLSLAACAEVPALDSRIDAAARAAPFPTLVNIDPLLAQTRDVPATNAALVSDVSAQVAALTARANALRSAIIEPPTRARMRRGVDTSALR